MPSLECLLCQLTCHRAGDCQAGRCRGGGGWAEGLRCCCWAGLALSPTLSGGQAQLSTAACAGEAVPVSCVCTPQRPRTELRLWWFGSTRPMAAQSPPGSRPRSPLRRPRCESLQKGWGCVGMEISPFSLVLSPPAVTSWSVQLHRAACRWSHGA